MAVRLTPFQDLHHLLRAQHNLLGQAPNKNLSLRTTKTKKMLQAGTGRARRRREEQVCMFTLKVS